MIELFPDQQESVDKVYEKMQAGCKYILLQGSTGSGKSIIATHIIQRAVNKGKRVMFSVPRRDLVRQMSSTFNDFNLDYSYIASGNSYNPSAQTYIASTDTLKRRLDVIKPPHLAIIDESHYGSTGLDLIIQWLKANGSYIIGLSATPWKMSGQGLGCWYDDMVLGPPVRWLINNNRLSDYRPFAPSHVDLSNIKTVAGDYAKGQLSSKMEQDRVLIGDAVNHYKKHAEGKLGVTFAVSCKHSQILSEEYRNKGIIAVHIDGETPMNERGRIFKAYARREIMQLCCAELLVFGFDIASASGIKDVTVECINDCKPTKSLAKQSQKWGRGLRYDKYNPEPHPIFDHANNFEEHGFPCSDRNWTLEDRKKRKGGNTEPTIPVRQCSECYFCHTPSPTCPNCGHEYPIQYREVEQIEGELTELEIKQEKKEKRVEVGMAKTFDDLKAIAKERNYATGWVFQMAKVKGIKK